MKTEENGNPSQLEKDLAAFVPAVAVKAERTSAAVDQDLPE